MNSKMNARALTLLALALVAVVTTDGAAGSAKAAAAPVSNDDCMGLATTHMAECLPFIQSGSTTEKPSDNCCSGFKVVLSQNPKCLCQLASVGASFGINVTKAANLPSACGVHDHSASECAVTPAPASRPTGPGAVPPTATPPTAKAPSPTTPAPNEPAATPSPAPSNSTDSPSSSSSIGISVSVFFAGLAAVLFTSF